MPDESGRITTDGVSSALADFALCENLSQFSAWTARWSARASGAETALLWTPDPTHPLLLCTGGAGEGARGFSRRSVGRGDPVVDDLLRTRGPVLLTRADFAAAPDGWLAEAPPGVEWCLLLPASASAEGTPAGILSLFFTAKPQVETVGERLEEIFRLATPALERALRAERKTAGMRQAIERLTALYDLSKAFGSTLEWTELTQIIVRKAVDFAGAEAGSLWLLDREADSAELAASAVNENYDIPEQPGAVGASVVGDVAADRSVVRRNRIPPGDPAGSGNPEYPVRSLLAVPLIEEEIPIGALVVVNKRGRVPEFSVEDQELLEDLSRQAVRALRNARQYEAEKKVEELDALLAVSREITATLDLDKVMQTIVNATAALVAYDRCAIAILDRGRLRLGAVSGVAELDRKSPGVRRTEELLQWVYFSGTNVNVTEQADGTIVAERPETEEKFRAFFSESGVKAFFAVILEDEEGKLGVLGFECREPIVFGTETRDLLQILVNQATVAVRNAQLYQQVPLAGFLKPLLQRGRRRLGVRVEAAPTSRRIAWWAGAAVLAALLFAVPWRLRVGGPARVVPGRRSVVAAGVDGVVASVRHREGDTVVAGEEIAAIEDWKYTAALAEARAGYQIVQAEVARFRAAGNAAATSEAESRRTELAARMASEEAHLAQARLVAPTDGVIVTPHLEDRVGQYFARGAELCVIADVRRVIVEVAVPESDASLIKEGQPATLKMNSYPTRTFRGTVSRVGARLREEGPDRTLIAEVSVENGDAMLKTGMLGKGKILAGRRSIATLLIRKPARWALRTAWPLLP